MTNQLSQRCKQFVYSAGQFPGGAGLLFLFYEYRLKASIINYLMETNQMHKFLSLIFFIIGIFILLLPYGYQMIGLAFLFLSLLFLLSPHRKLVGIILAISFSILVLLEVPIIHSARTTAPASVDYLILLGAGVNGTTPSLSLLDRMEITVDYMHANPDSKVIVSGGQGSDEDITEAQAMETYLLSQNIEPSRILKEEKATNTLENIEFSYELIEIESKKETTELTVAVVSSEYHLFRAKLCAQKLGYSIYTIAAPTSNWLLKINYFLREVPAVIKLLLT